MSRSPQPSLRQGILSAEPGNAPPQARHTGHECPTPATGLRARVGTPRSLQKSPKEYIDFDAMTGKRKVKCYKEGDKYSFNIDLTFTGTVTNNEMYDDMLNDVNKKKEFEKDMAKSMENQCADFIKIMKSDYKIDCIGLGREAAAVYGRQKGIDWNEVVSNANIKVNVKVNAELQGRGDY